MHCRQAATSPFFHFAIAVRAPTFSCHSWPAGQRHHASNVALAAIRSGVVEPLRSGCQVAATAGYASASITAAGRPGFPAGLSVMLLPPSRRRRAR